MRVRRMVSSALVLPAILALALIACVTPEGDAVVTSLAQPTVIPTATLAGSPTFAPTEHTPARTTHIPWPDADASVHAAFADAIITRDEYDRAVANAMACLDAKGIEHSTPVYNDARVQYDYSVTSRTGPGGVSEYDECWMRYERDIQAAWVQANEARIERVPVDEDAAIDCMRKFGFVVNTFKDIEAHKRRAPTDPAIQHCFVIGLMGFDPSVRGTVVH